MANVTNSVRTDNKSYEDIVKALNSAGVRTTSISQGKEADFEDYGNALSVEAKHKIMDSFDNERDYEMQRELAQYFTKSNVMNHNNFMAACKELGYSVERSSIKTSYISDYKAGNFSNSARNGSITMFTISDGMGGEIVIIDANGNGSIESEELFMNQILGDINLELGQIGTKVVSGSYGDSANGINGDDKSKEEVTQDDFNKKVEEYLNNSSNITVKEAERKARINLKSNSLTYTGSMEDKKAEDEVSQNEYNNKVEEYSDKANNIAAAEKMASEYFDVTDFVYTGSSEELKKLFKEELVNA